MSHFYITTPIYYVNDNPHIGHAYTTIAADVMARYHRLLGDDVKFLTGTDEHGQKVDKSAAKKGVSPQAFCDDISKNFRVLVNPCDGKDGENLLNAKNTDFIRTTEERHKKAAQAMWKRLEDNGYIYLDSYAGWYSVRDEAYYQESELIEKDGVKVAPTGAEVEWVEEESYFFKLSAFTQPLLDYYKANPHFIIPESRANEVIRFVEGGLKDLSISRTTFNWGVPVPGDDKHVMYVWLDALTNYLTSCGFPDDVENVEKWWGASTVRASEPSASEASPIAQSSSSEQGRYIKGHAVHLVGKDILRFHAVYWPAFLMAAKLPLPKQIVAHGWWTIEGEKMSKSLGNVLSPTDMIESAGGIDQLRYCMLRAMPFGNDGDFSQERMHEIINADLSNNIGNLAQRSLSMIQKNCDGKVPSGAIDTEYNPYTFVIPYKAAMSVYAYDDACKAMTDIARHANEYFQAKAPWALKKEGRQAEMEKVLYTVAETIRVVAILLQPFCPDAANRLLDQLAVPSDQRMFEHLSAEYALKAKTELPAPAPAFPRLEKKQAA